MPTSRRYSIYQNRVFPTVGISDIEEANVLAEEQDIVQPEPSEFKLRVSSALLSEVPMHWGLVQKWLEEHFWDVRLKVHMDLFYIDIFFKTRELYLEFVDKFPGFLQGS